MEHKAARLGSAKLGASRLVRHGEPLEEQGLGRLVFRRRRPVKHALVLVAALGASSLGLVACDPGSEIFSGQESITAGETE